MFRNSLRPRLLTVEPSPSLACTMTSKVWRSQCCVCSSCHLRNMFCCFFFTICIICDRLCINRPFTAKQQNPVFTSFSYRTFADNDDVFLFSIRLIVLKLYDRKCDTVENAHFEKRTFRETHISRNVRFQFRNRTPFTNSPTTTCNRFVFFRWIPTEFVSGPNFSKRCVVECRFYLWHKRENRRIASCILFWPVLKNYILRSTVGLCVDGHISQHSCISQHSYTHKLIYTTRTFTWGSLKFL